MGVFLSADQAAIYAGEDWMKRILDELESTEILVSLLSPTSIERPWINFEAGAAWMNRKVVIPVCIRGLSIGTLPKPYSSLQAIELDSFSGAYYLVSSIAHHLKIEAPEQPYFSPPEAALMGDDGDHTPDEIREIASPYKRLIQYLEIDRQAYEAEIVNQALEEAEKKGEL